MNNSWLTYLRLDEMTNSTFSHDRNRHGIHNLFNHLWVGLEKDIECTKREEEENGDR